MKLILIILLFISQSYLYAKPLAKVYFTTGEVFLKTQDKLITLKKQSYIENGQIIITKDKSLVVIGFGEHYQSKMKISSNTELYVNESLAKSTSITPIRSYNVFLKAGNLLIQFIKNRNKTLTVHTKTAALGIRGTSFFTHINEQGVMSMTVNEGEVLVNSANSDLFVPVSKGEGTMTNAKEQIIQPRKMQWHTEVNWNLSSSKGELFHSVDLFKNIEASYQKYKEEQQAKLENYRKEQKEKVDSWKQRNEDLRNKMFDLR